MTQDTALDILKLGYNVYLTGAAGSGKTYVLNRYIKYLRDNDVDVGVTASTGIAATHMGGVTIHSWTGLGIRGKLSGQDISSLMEKQYLAKRFEKVKVLIIDEISMMHHFRLDMVDELLQAAKASDKPFGGVQVILCGDFFQLPPISRKGERPSRFVYHSKVWRTAKFKICYLEEQHRQTDDASLRILNDIRNDQVSEDTIERLKTRFKDKALIEGLSMGGIGPGEGEYPPDLDGMDAVIDIADLESPDSEPEARSILENAEAGAEIAPEKLTVEPTRLFTHNIDVDSLNDEALDRIGGEGFEYYMESYGSDPLVDILKKSCLAPERLRLKIGARVMFVKNNFEAGYVNGTLGVVVDADDSGPTVKVSGGELIKAETETWEIEEDGKVKASITQYPLRLAWAITVHKSQGMSLDAVEVDLSRSFERGMGYVALSRVRTLEGLTILGLNDTALRVHDEVLMVDGKLRAASERAVGELDLLAGDAKENGKIREEKSAVNAEISRLQKEYLLRIAPTEKEKAKRISTFEQTRLLVEEGLSLKKMAKQRGLTEETIVDHLEKLIAEDRFFLETASYLRNSLPQKKRQLIRDAFARAYPKLSIEAGEPGSKDHDPSAYQKAPLAPVKHILGSKASYNDIRLMRALG